MINSASKEILKRLYYKMALIRQFEEIVLCLFQKGVLKGTTHVCIGQEAAAVGTCSELKAGDYVVSSHRGHGHYLAMGGDINKLMAEIFGKGTGCCGGRGGSQHIVDLGIGFLGANGITGGGIPLATGAGFSIKYRGTFQVAVCFFGDGASNQGTFHESLNMASLWKLPVVYICENNFYGMSMPLCSAVAGGQINKRAGSYDIPHCKIDGNDIIKIKRAVKKAVEHARKGKGPYFIEMETYRHKGHSKSDQCHYRSREEEAEWLKKCPLGNIMKLIRKERACSEEDIVEIDQEVKDMVNSAVQFAISSANPKL
jgi:TPP-dependent pyruvate/acetoin dehydrogenase alpha subunit